MSFVVYSVDSGDRMTLLGPPTGEAPNLKHIALSYIQAPKVAKRTVDGEYGPEEPCAFEAQELIRKTFIGKPVKFTEDYAIDVLQRRAGRVTLVDGEDASTLLLRNGLAIVPDNISSRMDKSLFTKYTTLMREAKAAKKGIFAPNASSRVRTLTEPSAEEKARLGEAFKGKEVIMRVEQVLLPTVLVVSGEGFGNAFVPVHMPGITVKDASCESVSQGARHHVERFLLHRNVSILFEGVDMFGNILGSVTSSKGTFQKELLSRGFVKLHGSTLGYSKFAAEMEAAEKEAREKRQGLWSAHKNADVVVHGSVAPSVVTATAAASSDGVDGVKGTAEYRGPAEFTGVMVQIITGDTVGIRQDRTGELIRVSLAGLRSSKNISREQDGRSPETRVIYCDYEWEAREFLRTHFVGKEVKVQVQYSRQIAETREVRPVVVMTVPETGANVGVSLLESGYVTFFLGKNDVCSAAAELQAASEVARSKGVGIHSKTKAPTVRILELSHLGSTRGRYYLNFLQRGMQGSRPPLVKGVVDFVMGPSSLRVLIPREHFQILIKVAGIITPMGTAAGGSGTAEPFAEESKRYAVDKIQHREVNVQVHAVDKAGNFISSVILSDGTDFAVSLVSMGFAAIANAERLPSYQLLLDAESKAKSEKMNIWSTSSSIPQRAVKLASQNNRAGPGSYTLSSGSKAEYLPYVLSEVGEDGFSAYLQDATSGVEEKLIMLQGLLGKLSSRGEYHPKRGEVVAAQYKADKTWNRAKVLHVSKQDSLITVCFFDFGTKAEVRTKDVRVIPQGSEFAPARDTEPLACLVHFAFLKRNIHTDAFIDESCNIVYEYTDGPVLAKELYRDAEGDVYCIVSTDENGPSVGESLLQHGVAVLDRATESIDPEAYKRHLKAQDIARRGHIKLWQYGDIDNDSDDERA
uniref:Uncharacterized protein TCIL3000_11_14500 n=1 Tax=Trypanosoma congolense (strain IL3000) TaxID=1068625 RepID=G0V2R1_TRYCI|nr:unnamed protein product [Trypanosoma congolense IL3000]